MMGAGAPIAFRHMQKMIFHIEEKTNWIGGQVLVSSDLKNRLRDSAFGEGAVKNIVVSTHHLGVRQNPKILE